MTTSIRGREAPASRSVFGFGIATLAVLASIPMPADATNGIHTRSPDLLQSFKTGSARDDLWIRLAEGVELAVLTGYRRQRDDLTRTEDRAFRGIGAIVCTVDGARRSSTAFLVGTFDIAVTVAHTFEHDGVWASSSDCVYHSADRWGQIRERIPVAYFKAQWRQEAASFGRPTKDLAVVRLSRASRFATRTLSFSRFSGSAAPVMLIGFRADPDYEPLKHKRSGALLGEVVNDLPASGAPLLMHDIDTRGLASGAPLLDRRDGVVIGIHARVPSEAKAGATRPRRNVMLVMTEWLERVLRAEISQLPNTEANQGAARGSEARTGQPQP